MPFTYDNRIKVELDERQFGILSLQAELGHDLIGHQPVDTKGI